VISDLHLGEDLKPSNTHVTFLRHIARLERELEAFLAYHTRNRLDGRPWRLVVNGDMVDFMSIMILPEPGSASVEEEQFGLGHGEAQSAAKLARVFERHPGVFRRLGEFVQAGNELVVIVGNHDVEFFYPDVQRCFIDRLTLLALEAAAPADDRSAAGPLQAESEPPAATERRIRDSIRFCPWFYYEENVVYVEHGHQYDQCCSFDYQLYPVEPVRGVTLSIAHACVRYFSNLVPTLDPHCGETWGFMDYMKWASAHGMRSITRIFQLYGFLIWKTLEIWSQLTDRKSDQKRSERHRRSLTELAERYQIAVDKLEALDGLRCPPVLKALFPILSTLFLDRMLVGVLATLGATLALAVAPGWHRKLVMAVGLMGVGVLANWFLGKKRALPSPQALRRVPEAIWRIMRAPFIVLGHSHAIERIELAGGGIYFNTGTWADTVGSDFPHLVIRPATAAPEAELRIWRDGASAPWDLGKRSR
jgi:UDP-2,3-diacylglucosamine pyrophosphatase LpxH